jgi:glycosyltransferase involved in cell wall biosynthesis
VTSLVHALHRRDGLVAVGLNPAHALPAAPHRSLLALPETTWATAAAFRAVRSNIYVQASPFEGMRPVQNLWPPFVLGSGIPLVTVLYDTIPFRDDTYLTTPEDRGFHHTRAAMVQQADLVLTISEATARDAVSDLGLDPARVVNIGSGVESAFGPGDDGAPLHDEPFVFSVCGWMERKNTDGLLRAWARLSPSVRSTHRLVVTCALKPDVLARWQQLAADLGIADRVTFTGAVPEAELLSLYRQARLFVYPSRYEGFGLPIAEAVACGTPAISSNTSSMPEVIGWAPGMFDPDDHDAMAALIERGLTDEAFRSSLADAGRAADGRHTWDAVAGRLLDAVAALADGRPIRIRPRVATVSAAGFVDSTSGSTFPVSAFGTTFEPSSYDVVVYRLGSADVDADVDAEVDVLRAALRHPGVVVLGGATLAPVYTAWARRSGDATARMRALLDDVYGDRIPGAVRYGDPLDASLIDRVGPAFLAGVARRSRVVVVPDDAVAAAVRLDVGPDEPVPDVRVGDDAEVVGQLLPDP